MTNPTRTPQRIATPGPLRIRAVAERTGVQAETLRAWERRYGVPTPGRTASAYRLYDAADLEEVEQMRDLVADGLRAAEAAVRVRDRRRIRLAREPQDLRGAVVEQIVQATWRYDVVGLDEALGAAVEAEAEAAFDRIVAPALVRIGELWSVGLLSVAQEHFASERIVGVLRSQLLRASAYDSGRTVLLACFEHDHHAIALLAVALRFASWGYRPIVLGADTPPDALAHAVAAVRPALVALSATLSPSDRGGHDLVAAYARAAEAVPWVVGGAGSAAIEGAIEAHGGAVARAPIVELHRTLRAMNRRVPYAVEGHRRRA